MNVHLGPPPCEKHRPPAPSTEQFGQAVPSSFKELHRYPPPWRRQNCQRSPSRRHRFVHPSKAQRRFRPLDGPEADAAVTSPVAIPHVPEDNDLSMSIYLWSHVMKILYFLLPAVVAAQDLARYSYVFLQASPDLTMGISPGNADPVWDPNSVYFLQLKSRSRNEFKADDDRFAPPPLDALLTFRFAGKTDLISISCAAPSRSRASPTCASVPRPDRGLDSTPATSPRPGSCTPSNPTPQVRCCSRNQLNRDVPLTDVSRRLGPETERRRLVSHRHAVPCRHEILLRSQLPRPRSRLHRETI